MVKISIPSLLAPVPALQAAVAARPAGSAVGAVRSSDGGFAQQLRQARGNAAQAAPVPQPTRPRGNEGAVAATDADGAATAAHPHAVTPEVGNGGAAAAVVNHGAAKAAGRHGAAAVAGANGAAPAADSGGALRPTAAPDRSSAAPMAATPRAGGRAAAGRLGEDIAARIVALGDAPCDALRDAPIDASADVPRDAEEASDAAGSEGASVSMQAALAAAATVGTPAAATIAALAATAATAAAPSIDVPRSDDAAPAAGTAALTARAASAAGHNAALAGDSRTRRAASDGGDRSGAVTGRPGGVAPPIDSGDAAAPPPDGTRGAAAGAELQRAVASADSSTAPPRAVHSRPPTASAFATALGSTTDTTGTSDTAALTALTAPTASTARATAITGTEAAPANDGRSGLRDDLVRRVDLDPDRELDRDRDRASDAPPAAPAVDRPGIGAPATPPSALASASAAQPFAAGLPSAPAAAEASLSARLSSSDFAPQLGAQITVWARDGIQLAQLHLNPAEMGPVTVQIQLDGNAAQLSLTADQAATRQALEQALPTLASSLREAGLTLTGGGVFDQARRHGEPGRDAVPGRRPTTGGLRTAAVGGLDVGLPVAPRRRGVVDLMA